MSTIRVNNLQNTSTTDGGISINASGHVTVDGVAMPSSGPLSNRNLIINGAMQVAQRGTQITGASSGYNFTCDRIGLSINSLGTWTIDQSSDSPNGFSNSVKATCTTANSSPAAGASLQFLYKIEAQDLQCLSYGNSGAQAATLSFWVKSNKTGNATVEFIQNDNANKLLSKEYTINSADTWEYKTISIPADTSGSIDNDNGLGMEMGFWLNTGSTFSSGSLKTAWGSYSAGSRNPSNLGVGGATSDYFAITGVQLEVGSVATPFEHRSYGDELARCLRYYWSQNNRNGGAYGAFSLLASYATSTDVRGFVNFPVPMRLLPALSHSSISDFAHLGGAAPTDILIADGGSNVNCTGIRVTISSNQTANYASILRANNTNNAELKWDAEL